MGKKVAFLEAAAATFIIWEAKTLTDFWTSFYCKLKPLVWFVPLSNLLPQRLQWIQPKTTPRQSL
ncbi:hypothetical protein [Mesobacillus foraminis]|uniref:hypothetical protein n=1 Tax=Mesobacillus foraminis TaxID=279826 RepID=UPI002035BE55|nr:hypothetical protein [Mesobacillus foraminis]